MKTYTVTDGHNDWEWEENEVKVYFGNGYALLNSFLLLADTGESIKFFSLRFTGLLYTIERVK